MVQGGDFSEGKTLIPTKENHACFVKDNRS